jgi:hypothetical protein
MVEKCLGLVQPLLGEARVASPAQDQRAAAEMPDAKPMLSPMTAATKPTTPTATTLSLPAPA